MLTLYQREECPYSALVRRTLGDLGLSFASVNAPKLSSERKAVLALPGVDIAEVPVLVDDDTVVQGSQEIVDYLREKHALTRFGDPTFGLTRYLDGFTYGDAVAHVTEKLGEEGFGIISEIDVRATMKTKLDVDFPNYVILGACNPPLAHAALSDVPAIGLLLPSLVGREDIEPLAADVRGRLRRAIAAL